MTKFPKTDEWVSIYFKSLNLAWKDSAFAEALVANPREALKSRFGYHPPSHIQLEFVRMTKGESYPPAQAATAFDRPHGSPTLTFRVPLPGPPPGLMDVELSAKPQASDAAPSNLECWCCCA